VGGGEQAEDLFLFTVKHVTIKKGQRMVMPVVEFVVPYKDVFVLDLPFTPPPEVSRGFGNQQQAELARLKAAPKVMHKIRLENKSDCPLTTAPALIVRDDKLLAQGLMTYTAIGGSTDLAITAAVDIQVKKTDNETKRTPNSATFDGHQFVRVDLAGAVTLTNFKKQAVELEVVRNVLGNVTEADKDGKVEMVNIFEDSTFAPSGGGTYPYWWSWYDWPSWWRHFNGIGRITWKVTLEAGKGVELKYVWNYYWR
jgi:hypothetical protein